MTRTSEIIVHLCSPLREACGGAAELSVTAPTLRVALGELERSYPKLYRSVCDETATVRRHVNVFINQTHMRDCNGLDTPLASGDVVTILPAVSGG